MKKNLHMFLQMKNINKKILIFGIVLVFLAGSLISLSAKTSDMNSEKISFSEWFNNFFKFTGNQIAEENFVEVDLFELFEVDLSSELDPQVPSNIQKIELEEGIDYKKQGDSIIFSGSGAIRTNVARQNQIGKDYDYSLGEGGSLTINSLTGEVEEVKNLKLDGDINLDRDLDKFPPNIRGFPDGAILSYSKENSLLEIELPDKRKIMINNAENFDIYFAHGEIQTLNFDATDETNLEIFNGRFSFGDGGKVSMDKRVLKSSSVAVEKFPNPGKTSFETLVEGRVYEVPGIAIESEEIILENIEHLGGSKTSRLYRGFIAIDEKGYVSVPASKEAAAGNTFEISFPMVREGINKPGIAEPVYFFGDEEIAKASGKSNYVANKYSEEEGENTALIIHNGGQGKAGESFELSFFSENQIIPFVEGGRLSFLADETKKGSVIIDFQERDAMSGKLLENYAEIYGEGIAFGDDGNDYFWKDGKYVSSHDTQKSYSNAPGVNMHIITQNAQVISLDGEEVGEKVGVLITNQGKTSYFDTTTKTTDEFQAEYKKIGREAVLKEHPVLSRQSLVEGRVRQDTSRFLGNPQTEAIAKDMTNNIREIQKFQRENLPSWKQSVGEETYQRIFASVDPNDQNKLDNAITKEINKEIYLTSDKTANYQPYENAILAYQNNRDNLIGAGIIDPKDSSFPNYFGLEEEKEIYKIMQSQNLDHEQAAVKYFQDNDLLIGPRALFRKPNFNTISIWKTNYGARDIREEFQKIIK